MLFHTWEFIGFYVIVYFLYLNLSHNLQNRILLIASYYFYGSWDWRYLSLLVISTTVDYFCGLKIQNSKAKKHKKIFVIVSIFVNLSILGVFKYYNFFADNFHGLMKSFSLDVHPYFINVALPLGISFYTFQTMSYSIDIYRGKLNATRNFFDFALYVSFFPQLVAGPIERGTRLLPQILNERKLNLYSIYKGFYLFLWGLFLKVFIADNLAKIVDPTFENYALYDGIDILISVYAFSLQIYCDFAGYSFMAIGLGLTMGIQLKENFRRPYLSKNISDFWRRWHISLSSWLRDYLYIPLGGNHKGFKRTCLNIFITMLLGGLWHGADWNFVFFGIYHGIMIGLYFWINPYWGRLNDYLQIFITFQIVALGWLIFRASSLDQVFIMLWNGIYNFGSLNNPTSLDLLIKLLVFSSILVLVQIFQEIKNDTFIVLRLPLFPRYAFITALLLLIAIFGDFGGRPYIYFQF